MFACCQGAHPDSRGYVKGLEKSLATGTGWTSWVLTGPRSIRTVVSGHIRLQALSSLSASAFHFGNSKEGPYPGEHGKHTTKLRNTRLATPGVVPQRALSSGSRDSQQRASKGQEGDWALLMPRVGPRTSSGSSHKFSLPEPRAGLQTICSRACLCSTTLSPQRTLHPCVLPTQLQSQTHESESVRPSAVSDSLRPHGLHPSVRLLCPWDSPGKNTGVACHFLLQGIFSTQGSNPGLLCCRQIPYHLGHQGSPSEELQIRCPFRSTDSFCRAVKRGPCSGPGQEIIGNSAKP